MGGKDNYKNWKMLSDLKLLMRKADVLSTIEYYILIIQCLLNIILSTSTCIYLRNEVGTIIIPILQKRK